MSVHSMWPSTPPSTIGTADGALGCEVSSRKENWLWSPSSVASDTKYVCRNRDSREEEEAAECELAPGAAAETHSSVDCSLGCGAPSQLSRYVSYSICTPNSTHAVDATPRSTVSPQLVNMLALTLDSTALSTARVAAAAFEPNSSVRLEAERSEEVAGREEERKRVDRKVLSPNSAMKMRQREEKKEDRKDEAEAEESDEETAASGAEAREEVADRAAVDMEVKLSSAR